MVRMVHLKLVSSVDSKDFMLVCSEIIKQVLLDNLCISIDKDELGLEPIDKLVISFDETIITECTLNDLNCTKEVD